METVSEFRKREGPLSDGESQMAAQMVGQFETLVPGKETIRDCCLLYFQQIIQPLIDVVQVAANMYDGSIHKFDYLATTHVHVTCRLLETQELWHNFGTNMTTVEHDIDEAGAVVQSDKKRVPMKVAPKFIQVNGATGIPLMPASPAPRETNAHTKEISSFLMQQRKSTLGNAAVVAAMCSDNIFRDGTSFWSTVLV